MSLYFKIGDKCYKYKHNPMLANGNALYDEISLQEYRIGLDIERSHQMYLDDRVGGYKKMERINNITVNEQELWDEVYQIIKESQDPGSFSWLHYLQILKFKFKIERR